MFGYTDSCNVPKEFKKIACMCVHAWLRGSWLSRPSWASDRVLQQPGEKEPVCRTGTAALSVLPELEMSETLSCLKNHALSVT